MFREPIHYESMIMACLSRVKPWYGLKKKVFFSTNCDSRVRLISCQKLLTILLKIACFQIEFDYYTACVN